MKNLSSLFGKDNLDEIVFANRNKAYGAYAIRNNYSSDLTKAVVIGVAFFASLSVVPLVLSAFAEKIIPQAPPVEVPIGLIPVETPDIQKSVPVSVVPPNVKTVVSNEYTPVREVKKESTLPTVEDIKGAAVSTETKGGDETTIAYVPPVVTTGPPAATYSPPVKPANPDEVFSTATVDVAADFKGGIDAFRQKVAQNFDTESIDKSGMVSGVITFIVERDGSISNLKITGSDSDFNAEAARTVKSIKTKWTPAQLKGKAVRSSFRMPITMKIE